MIKLIGFEKDKDSFQIYLFPFFIFGMWGENALYINITFIFITFGFKVDFYDTTYIS